MKLLQEFQYVIGVIILLAIPLSVNALAQLTGMLADDISNRLNRFHSVLSIPDDFDAPVRILHLSFRDFLVNQTSGRFHVDEEATHRKIASHCLRRLQGMVAYYRPGVILPILSRLTLYHEEIEWLE